MESQCPLLIVPVCTFMAIYMSLSVAGGSDTEGHGDKGCVHSREVVSLVLTTTTNNTLTFFFFFLNLRRT